MKKAISVLLTIALILSAVGCSSSHPDREAARQPSPSADTVSSETEPSPKPSAAPKAEYDNIIEISTAEQLVAMSREYGENINACKNNLYILTDDIDMAGVEGFVPIGKVPPYEPDPVNGFPRANLYTSEYTCGFAATFDGQGHTVKNLTLTYEGNSEGKKGDSYAGFFFNVVKGGVVKNLNIENITIDAIGRNAFHNSTSGALAGHFAGYAENCHVSGKISAIECSGGFVGRVDNGTEIYGCTADVDISGCWYTAGFIGYADVGEIYVKDCASFGSVTAYIPSMYLEDIRDVGGFGGHLYDGTYENCHAQTELIILDPALSVGGLVAFANQGYTELINCTYHPAYTGNWDLLFSINHVTCNGNYGPYTFTADKNVSKHDFYNKNYGADSEPAEAVSKDGKYIIYENNRNVAADGGEIEYTLKEVFTGKEKLLGKVYLSRNSGAGFFQNGDVYIFDEYSGIKIFDTDMDNQKSIFESQDNFPCGDDTDGTGTERYIFAIRRDPVNFDYIVVYGEFNRNADGNYDAFAEYPYRIGLLDKNGILTQSWQLPVEFNSYDFYKTHMFKSGDTEIEIYAEMKDQELFRIRFDYVTQNITQIK